MTSEELDKTIRWARLGVTWFRKATRRLASAHEAEARSELRWLIGNEAHRLLEGVLDDATMLVPILNDGDEATEIEQLAQKLAALLRSRRLASALSNVEGRTPEEAETYLRKAAELTGSSG